MVAKKTRMDMMDKFFYFIDRLQTVISSQTPHERTLDQNTKNLEEFLPIEMERLISSTTLKKRMRRLN